MNLHDALLGVKLDLQSKLDRPKMQADPLIRKRVLKAVPADTFTPVKPISVKAQLHVNTINAYLGLLMSENKIEREVRSIQGKSQKFYRRRSAHHGRTGETSEV